MAAPMLFLFAVACTQTAEVTETGDSGGTTPDPVHEDGTASLDMLASGTPPTAPTVSISPSAPAAGAAFSALIVTDSDDMDGDEVSYRYAWTVDGEPSDLATAEVSGVATEDFQVWEVTVTPNDGKFDGPAVSAAVTIGNAPPSAPVIHIDPENPTEGDDLTVIYDTTPVDPEGDPLTTTISWYDDDAYMPDLDGDITAEGKWVQDQEVFRVVVSVTDGYHDALSAEATVEVHYTCDNLPPFNQGDTSLSDARGYHGLAFDVSGYLVGWDGRGSLVQSAYDGTRITWAPGVDNAQQIDRLPDGDIVYGDSTNGTLVRVYSTGATATLATDMTGVYGVAVGPDGKVWAVVTRGIVRVDPDTGESETVVVADRSITMHSLAFNLDSTVLYIGVIGTSKIYQVALDPDLNAIGSPSVYATGVGIGYHDGIGVDECGNLYVADYSSSGLYRVETDGTVTSMVTPTSTQYGHGVTWGEDVGGWNPLALYQPQPYNSYTVREVVIGFASGDTVRTWNGVAVPY